MGALISIIQNVVNAPISLFRAFIFFFIGVLFPTPGPTPSPMMITTPSPMMISTPSPMMISTPNPMMIPTRSPSSSPSKSPSLSPSKSPSLSPSISPMVTPAAFLPALSFPVIDGQTTNLRPQSGVPMPADVVCGAIQAVLALPTNSDICFAGATNGGVWRTTSCTADQPDWMPLTDSEDSLSVGDMVFDENDPSGNTIVVAIGTRSSFSQAGGIAIGMLRTTNALSANPTWTVLDNAAGGTNFRSNSVKFRSLFVRGNLMLAAAYVASPNSCPNTGIWRSTDTGVTWTNVQEGKGLAVASDPNDPNRFYAVLDEIGFCGGSVVNGVLISNDQGATWTPTANVVTTIGNDEMNNAKLSVSADNSRVWVALLKNGQAEAIAHSDDQGTSWTLMDDVLINNGGTDVGLNPRVKPGSQGSIHFALLASPTNNNEVYVGGDRQDDPNGFPNAIGATDFTGNLVRGDASVAPTSAPDSPQWEHMTNSDSVTALPQGGTASSSAPHADCRDMELRADGAILEGGDGGITLRTSPSDNTGDWFGLCGNLQTFETHNVAYEPVCETILYGNQDNGSMLGTLGMSGTFRLISGGDGSDVMIDHTSDPNNIYYYYGSQRFGSFDRLTCSKNTCMCPIFGENILGFGQSSFVGLSAMNPNDQRVFAVFEISGSFALTLDRGNVYTSFSAGTASEVNAMIWSQDGMFMYYSSGTGFSAPNVGRCAFANGPLMFTCAVRSTLPGTSVARHIAVNPSDNNEVVVAVTPSDADYVNPSVSRSTDGGMTFTDITVPGSLLDMALLGGSVVFLPVSGVNTIAVGTSSGVLIPDGGIGVGWKLLAPGLPTVPVLDMVYEATDDTLVLATLGRGVWYLRGASAVAAGETGSFTNELPSNPLTFEGPVEKTLVPPEDYF